MVNQILELSSSETLLCGIMKGTVGCSSCSGCSGYEILLMSCWLDFGYRGPDPNFPKTVSSDLRTMIG